MPRIIAITGLAGAGKSTAACILIAQYNFKLVKFADPLKDMLRSIGLTTEDLEDPRKKGLPCKLLGNKSPRYAMQTLGTDWGRIQIHEDLWANIWKHRAKQFLLDGAPVVCDDLRFENEVEVVKELGGEIWAIRRKDAAGQGSYLSESGMAMRRAERWLPNNGSVEDLHRAVVERMSI